MQAGLALIEIDAALQELDKAAAVIPLLRQVAPTDPRVLYAAYRIYSDLAEEAMLDLSVAAPESGQMHQMMAHQQYQAGDLTSAIANLQKAIAANPNLPGIHFELAEALHISPDPQVRSGAEAEYKLAVAANSRDAKALTRLGDIAVDKNDLDLAATFYQQALAITPNDPDASIGLAHVYTEKGQPELALPLLTKRNRCRSREYSGPLSFERRLPGNEAAGGCQARVGNLSEVQRDQGKNAADLQGDATAKPTK